MNFETSETSCIKRNVGRSAQSKLTILTGHVPRYVRRFVYATGPWTLALSTMISGVFKLITLKYSYFQVIKTVPGSQLGLNVMLPYYKR